MDQTELPGISWKGYFVKKIQLAKQSSKEFFERAILKSSTSFTAKYLTIWLFYRNVTGLDMEPHYNKVYTVDLRSATLLKKTL